jgi:hypothetical protein
MLEHPGGVGGGPIVWRPSAEQIAQSNLARFMRLHGIGSLEELLAKRDPAWFWRAVLEDLDIRFYRPFSQVMDVSRGIARPRWCVDGCRRRGQIVNLKSVADNTAARTPTLRHLFVLRHLDQPLGDVSFLENADAVEEIQNVCQNVPLLHV